MFWTFFVVGGGGGGGAIYSFLKTVKSLKICRSNVILLKTYNPNVYLDCI